MKERPILFKGPMVVAIGELRKTQTRRVIDTPGNTPHGDRLLCDWGLSSDPFQYDGTSRLWRWQGRRPPKAGDWIQEIQTDVDDHATYPIRNPYGKVGDRLWVRETWKVGVLSGKNLCDIHYQADGAIGVCVQPGPPFKYRSPDTVAGIARWRPSILMPRWASRYLLEITGIRPERLHQITDEDAIAEGIQHLEGWAVNPKAVYQNLWDSINGKQFPWSGNWLVWRIEFRRIEA
jgi:hypothetical protein